MSHYDDILRQAAEVVESAASTLSVAEQIKAAVSVYHASIGAPPFRVDGIAEHRLPDGTTVYVVAQCVQQSMLDAKGRDVLLTALHHDLVMQHEGRYQVIPMQGGGH